MDRHLYSDSQKLMAIVKPEGTVTFHKESGFEAKDPVDIMTQEATVMMLREQGFREIL